MTLKALLFDLDGTLADTDRLHEQAWIEALARHGIQADHHFYQTQISGGVNLEIVGRVLPQLGLKEAQAFIDGKEARFRELAHRLEPITGVERLVAWAEGRGLRQALVSNAPRINAEHVLEALGLEFDPVILSDDLGVGKPDPLPYLTALKLLGVGAEETVAFEDSPSGVRAAVAAGIRCVGISSGHDPAKLEAGGVFLLVDDFTDRRLWEWLEGQ
ncbi:MAG: HAD-IA family hydrolase [Meiothermus sp.]|nr:HAD-IA family hydrolase [Meiothermus sp.]